MGSESSVMSALASSGVISIAIDASTMQFYAGGIFTGQGFYITLHYVKFELISDNINSYAIIRLFF